MNPYTRQFVTIYEAWTKKSPREIKDWLRGEIRYLKRTIGSDSRILEVGCGYGRILKALGQYEIWGIDNSRMQLREAKRHCGTKENIHLVLGDARKMPFKKEFFDYSIIMANTLGNLGRDKTKVLREMRRVTRKGGLVIASVYNDSDKTFRIRLASYKKLQFPISLIKKKKIYITARKSKGTIISEQFFRTQLERIFQRGGFSNATIRTFHKIGYLVTARVF